MSQHVITAPSPPIWRRRSLVVVALVVVLAVGVGATIAALVSSDSSTTHRSAAAPPKHETSALETAGQCTVPDGSFDGGYLLALFASMPDDAAGRVTASLSPPVMQLVGDAALAGGFASFPISPANAPTLAGVLSRLSAADRAAVLNELPRDVFAEVSPLIEIAGLPSCGF